MHQDPCSTSQGLPHARIQAEERLNYLRSFVQRLLTIWTRQVESLRGHPDPDVAQCAAVAAVGAAQLSRLVSLYGVQSAQGSTIPVLKLAGALIEVDDLMRALESAQARALRPAVCASQPPAAKPKPP